VFGLGDVVVAAIGIAGPASRFTEPRIEELANAVRDAALIVSRALAASPAATVAGARAS